MPHNIIDPQLNQRRVELINKKYRDGLTADESAELDTLQLKARSDVESAKAVCHCKNFRHWIMSSGRRTLACNDCGKCFYK